MNGLGRAAQKLIPELERYNISVYMLERRVVWYTPYGTRPTWVFRAWLPVWYYRRKLRRIIAVAKINEGRL